MRPSSGDGALCGFVVLSSLAALGLGVSTMWVFVTFALAAMGFLIWLAFIDMGWCGLGWLISTSTLASFCWLASAGPMSSFPPFFLLLIPLMFYKKRFQLSIIINRFLF